MVYIYVQLLLIIVKKATIKQNKWNELYVYTNVQYKAL